MQGLHEDRFWLREDLSIADELTALAPKLREEFLNYHSDFIDGEFSKGKFFDHKIYNLNEILNKQYAWKTDFLKYSLEPHEKNGVSETIKDDYYLIDEVRNRYPTAVALTEKYAKDCPISSYSILEPDTIIKRHTDIENRDAKFIRIHIPLIVPEGECFFECEGYEIDWSDIWAFNNQRAHSAYNLTDRRRLVYIFNISRSILGIEDSKYSFDFEVESATPPFVRGALPKVYHTVQLSK